MFPFSQSVTPAARTHLEAQLAYFIDYSKSLFRSVQQYNELNIQLAQTILEETSQAGQRVLTANRATEAIAAAAAHAQPTAEKLRAYQQHLSRIAADTQVNLSQVAEDHVQETSRTAKALADEVARITSEETEKAIRSQQAAVEKYSDPFVQQSDGARRSQNGVDGREAGNLQASQQAAAAQAAAQSAKQSGARKET